MIELENVEFAEAQASLLLANTPDYLLRKLREDPTVVGEAHRRTSQEILGALQRALEDNQDTLRQMVRPYVFLVMLFLRGEREEFKAAVDLQPQGYRWYSRIASRLKDEPSETRFHKMRVTPFQAIEPKQAAKVRDTSNAVQIGGDLP